MTRMLAIVVMLAAAPAAAQTPDAARIGRVEVDAGGGWLAGADLGSGDANLRAATATPTPFRLFSVDSRFAAAPSIHARAGYALSRRFVVEGGITLSHPELRASISNDVEAAPPITIAERIDQYGIDASLVVMLHELAIGARTLPFLAGGTGYLRQLHEGQTVVEQGHFFHAGGGVKHWLLARDRGFLNGAGVRVDARVSFMSGGIEFEDRPRPQGAVSGSVFLAF